MIVTNGHHRDIIDGYELSDEEIAEFDYLDWTAIREGRDSASFFRYRGELYDLGEFTFTGELSFFSEMRQDWDGYRADSFFSGMVVRYADDFEGIVVGRYFS